MYILTPRLLARFMHKHKQPHPESCWIWRGWLAHGYPIFQAYGRRFYAHKVAYHIYHCVRERAGLDIHLSDIPKSRLTHICLNKRCVNPTHLRVTRYRIVATKVGSPS